MTSPQRPTTDDHVSLLFRNSAVGQLVTLINAGVLVFAFGGIHAPWWASAWWGAVAVVALARLGLARAFEAAGPDARAQGWRWRRRAVWGALLAGIVWSVGSAAMMVADPGMTRLFVALFSAGMVAGAVPLLSAEQNAFRAYALPVSITFGAVALFDAHNRFDWALGLVDVLFLGAMLRSSDYFYTALEQASRLTAQMRGLTAQLENSERLFRTLAESTGVAIFTYRDHVEYINPAGERLCGYTQDELQHMPFSAIIHPEDRANAEQRGRERIEGDGSFGESEYRIVTKQGLTRWLLFHGAAVELDGRRVGLGSAFDITERKQAEQRLVQSEALFHTMIDWTHDWEYWLNPEGGFYYMTPSAQRVSGYTAQEFTSNPALLDAIVHPDDRAAWDAYRHRLVTLDGADTPAATLDLRILKKSGELRWVQHLSRPVHDASGRAQGLRVTVRDITEAKSAQESIRQLAYYDPLTHLPNRRLLMDRLGQALNASERNREYGALLILDLDQFKALNDTQGHDTGDAMLIEVARRLVSNVRQEDTIARLGGDEYVVVLERLGVREELAAAQAEHIAEKIRLALAHPYVLGQRHFEHHSSVSLGVALFRGNERAPDVLLKEADVALYQAKDAGRNVVRFFNPAMQAGIEARLALINAMRKGLERGEFELHYQAQCDAANHVIGAEALLRWHCPERGLVPPDVFIPLAEDSGLILPLGAWVLETACAQLKRWADDPRTAQLRLSVNVSARQFHQPDFVDSVRRCLRTHGANPRRLELELTESIVLNNVDGVVGRMHELNALGVEFALDDFGTGYSSLSYLKRLPLAEVKIDQSFVRDAPHDPNDAAIVKAILAISATLGLRVVAEGVETAEQLEFLRANGCRVFQGYWFSRPLPIAQWTAWQDLRCAAPEASV